MIRSILAVVAALVVTETVRANGFDDLQAGHEAQVQGDLDKAIQLYTRALDSGELTQEDQVVAHNRCIAHTDKGNYDVAILDCDATIRLNPNALRARAGRGFAHFFLGRFNEAADDFAQALGIHPTAYGVP
jgi:tetratricopeptide (TPR) repeat protein